MNHDSSEKAHRSRRVSAAAIAASLPDILIDATGARCELFDALGFSQTTVFKSARALCIVIHLVNHKTGEELRLEECTWSQQFHQKTFKVRGRRGRGERIRA